MSSTVSVLAKFCTLGFASNFVRSANGIRTLSVAKPAAFTFRLVTYSELERTSSGKSSPRGILMANVFSRRKTMSRKSIDSAQRSPTIVADGETSSSSTPRASIRAVLTFSKISSRDGIDCHLANEDRKRPETIPASHGCNVVRPEWEPQTRIPQRFPLL